MQYDAIAARPVDRWLVERVEVIGGPSSFLHGSGAVGGAINVITKVAALQGDLSQVRLGVGDQLAQGPGGPWVLDARGLMADGVPSARWLFAFLHSFDLSMLLASRPAWDLCMLGFSLAGLGPSLTAVVTGWRRLHRKAGRAAAARDEAALPPPPRAQGASPRGSS